MIKKLSGKTALITGAGRGIGRATAILFAQNGASLILVARTSEELKQTAARCEKENMRVHRQSIDLSDLTQIDTLFNGLPQGFKKIDILINNASHFDAGLIKDYSIADFRLMLDTNLLAPLYLSQKVIAMMDEKSGGTIVNISSFSGCFGVEKFPGFGAYNISKYALWGLTEILALENRNRDIRVNQISPSGVDTEMFRKAVPPGVTPDLSPEDVARHILFLASDESAPLTGENIMLS
jgi:3-oxoacyl-[acyl-carrier protein] reductase